MYRITLKFSVYLLHREDEVGFVFEGRRLGETQSSELQQTEFELDVTGEKIVKITMTGLKLRKRDPEDLETVHLWSCPSLELHETQVCGVLSPLFHSEPCL